MTRRISMGALLLLLTTTSATAQTFTDVAQSRGWPNSNDDTRGLGWADYDGDGDFDVYLQNAGANSRLLRNDGPVFTIVTAAMAVSHASSGWSVAWGDYDNDGKTDLYLGNFAGNNCFSNQFPAPFADVSPINGTADATFAQSVVWVDFDRDGLLDLYLTKEFDPHRFFRNVGGGNFQDITAQVGLADPQSHSYGVAWGDFDADGDPDCYVSTCGVGTINRLFRSNVSGLGQLQFSEVGALAGVDYSPNTYGTEWVDLDDDGDLDLFVTGAAGELNHLYRNDGVLPLIDVAVAAGVAGPVGAGHGCDFGDYDNDGRVDIFVHDRIGPSRLYRNLGGLQFVEVPNASGASNPTGGGRDCAFVDFDNDGFLDIHLATSARDRLFRNSGNAHHYLSVVPIGTKDNRSAVGVTIELTIGGVTQRRLYNGAAGAFSQNLLPAHFGLGAATVVDQVTVRWLDGTSDTVSAVAADQRIVIQQSSGTASAEVVGVGCATGTPPSLLALSLPTLPNPAFGLQIAGAPAGVGALLLAGPKALAALDVGGGCLLQLDLPILLATLQLGVNPLASGSINPGGLATFPFPLPDAVALLGFELTTQGLVLDPSGPTGAFTLTNALDLRLGR